MKVKMVEDEMRFWRRAGDHERRAIEVTVPEEVFAFWVKAQALATEAEKLIYPFIMDAENSQ